MSNEKDTKKEAEVGKAQSKAISPVKSKAVSVKRPDPSKTAEKVARAKASPSPIQTDAVIALEPKAASKPKAAAPKTSKASKATPKAAPAPKSSPEKKAPASKPKAAPKADKSKPGAAPKTASKSKKHILFVASEAAPYAGTGGLGEVIGSLPKAINALDGEYEASVIVPLYESVSEKVRESFEFMFHMNVPLGWRNQYCGLFRYKDAGVTYYFVDNEYYFKRPNLYGYYDDGERFAFFSRAVNELLTKLDHKPDVLHCHDWQTALVPIYYKLYYMYREGYGGIKTIFTIHNIEYQGKYGKNIIEDVFGISNTEYLSLEHGGCVNLVKGAIDYSDAVSTVSPTYAAELENDFYAHGLADVICANRGKMRGILNGIDTDAYNPETNPALFMPFSTEKPGDKAKNKAELQKMLSLPVNADIPVVAIISRLVSHKGLDLIRFSMNEILKMNLQLVVLGKGDPDYEGYFVHVQKTYNTKVASVIAFNKDLSHKIYAASDIFLMPSKSEPCGLSQMMACRYGTVPVVRATGGLRDSIVDCGAGDEGNGFSFISYDAADMLHGLSRAVGLYTDYKDKWKGLMSRCMKTDFSWKSSAREYMKFYSEL